MDYTTLSLADVRAVLDDVAADAQSTFGALDARQLNWRPDAKRWSVAQCLEHLMATNRLMRDAAGAALDEGQRRTMWQRVPLLPGMLGRVMIRSLTPEATRTFVAPPAAQPAQSDIAADVVDRFAAQQRDLARRLQGLDDRRAARATMTSPFARVVVYSVLDGWRIVAAHDRRHVEQARRVMQSPGFPQSVVRSS